VKEPGGRSAVLLCKWCDRRAPSTLAAGDESPMNPAKRPEACSICTLCGARVANGSCRVVGHVVWPEPTSPPYYLRAGCSFISYARPAHSSPEPRGWLLRAFGPAPNGLVSPVWERSLERIVGALAKLRPNNASPLRRRLRYCSLARRLSEAA
jgi:hypothetical protein